MGLQILWSPVRSRSHPSMCISFLVSLDGQDTWFSPTRPGFDSRTRKFHVLKLWRNWQRVGFQTRRLGVRLPLASYASFFLGSSLLEVHGNFFRFFSLLEETFHFLVLKTPNTLNSQKVKKDKFQKFWSISIGLKMFDAQINAPRFCYVRNEYASLV